MNKGYRNTSIIVIVAVLLLTGIALSLVSKLSFNYDFEKFFPKDDPETAFYQEFRSVFSTDNDYLLIGVKNEEGVFREDFLQRFDSLQRGIEKIKFVDNSICLLDSIEMRRGGLLGEPYSFPPIKANQPDYYSVDSAFVMNNPQYLGTLISKDAKSMAIWVNHEAYLSKLKCDTLANEINAVLDTFDFDEKHASGRAMGQKVYIEMMQFEMGVFMSLSFVLIVIFLYIAFRSMWGIAVPVAIVMLAIVWNLAAIKLLGHQIDLMLTILPTIIFVVGMSDAVHITTKYIEELRLKKEKKEAIRIALREVGLATLLTSVTTAIGFLSLVTSNIEPISLFGIHTSIGVILAFLLSYSILPVVFYLMPLPKISMQNNKRFEWERVLRPTFRKVLKHRKRILLVSVGMIMLSFYGISLVVSDNFLLEDIKEDHFLRKEIQFFESEFAGARPLEIALLFKDFSPELDLEVLEDMEKLDDYLKEEFGMGAITSVVQIVKKANQMYQGGVLEDYKLPSNNRKLKKVLKFIERNDILGLYWSPEHEMARVSGQTHDLGRKYYDKKILEFNAFVDKELKDAKFEPKITGTARLLDINNEKLAETMIYGLIIAFVVIAFIVGVMYKSVKMVFISLIPNILPLLFIGCIMGFAGIALKVSTSIIFTIAFGIAVDDTIHFLSKFRLELAKGRSELYALKRTFLSTGKAIIVTTCILCGGFLTLLFSDFLGTYYIGLLIGLTLVFAVLSDLILLPVLILIFYKKR